MTRHRFTLWSLALLPLALWCLFILPDQWVANERFWPWRRALILLSGTLALWWMSAGMVLAVRPRVLERPFGGLDRLYRLHKDLGIGAGLIVLIHWMLEWLPKNLAKLGWIERPLRRGRGPKGPEDFWVDLAKEVGEWAGYLLLALVVVALVRRIPYRYFRWVHKVFPLLFLAGVFHGAILMPTPYWQTPLAWTTLALALVGSVAAVWSLSGRIGRARRFPARIEAVDTSADGVLRVVCRPSSGWPGHRAGQFVFADFSHRAEGAHPFTVASAWRAGAGTLTLAIKALGDYTGTLAQRLRAGQAMTLEGPYGCFDFGAQDGAAAKNERQVWVAGGIGVTPFLARLQVLALQGGHVGLPIDFFYCTPARGPGDFAEGLDALCAAAGVRLHRRATDTQGMLAFGEVRDCLPAGDDSCRASVWFCGPAAWGSGLKRDLQRAGLPAGAFHREAFDFR